MCTRSKFAFLGRANPIQLSPTLILTCFITCFGSSLLYGYNISVFNGPKTHIECFISETMLGISPCPIYSVSPSNGTNDSYHAADASSEARTRNVGNQSQNRETYLIAEYKSNNTTGVTSNSASMEAIHKIGFYYSLLTTVWIIFGAIGAFCTGAISNYFGRRNGLLFNNAFAIAGAAIGAPAVAVNSPALLYIGRAFAGFNCGVTIGLASIYLTEIAPVRSRGAIGGCHQLAVTAGILLAFLCSGLQQTFNRPGLWIVAHCLTGLPALVSMAILPLCPESPRFLFFNRHDETAAAAALLRFFPDEDAQQHLEEMRAEAPAASALMRRNGDGNGGDGEKEEEVKKFRFVQLLTLRDLRMPVALAVCVQVMQQLSGINAVMSYSTAILNSCGIPHSSVPYVNLSFSAFNFVCTAVSLPLLERLGRRRLLLWPTALLATSLVVLTVCAVLVRQTDVVSVRHAVSILFVVFIFVYTAGFSLGLGTIPGFIVAELFRQEPRSAAYSLSQGVQWISNLLVSTTFVNLQLAMGGYVFLVYLSVVVPLWVFFFACMPETRGRSFDSVANDLAFPGAAVCRRGRRASQAIVDEDGQCVPLNEPANNVEKLRQKI